MADRLLRFLVRTPERVAFDESLESLRVPALSGQVGLRPRAEPCALAIEPGLLLARAPAGLRFLASAGGLLRCDGREASLVTPVAVVGGSAREVGDALDRALRETRADLELRAVLQRLETGILVELRRDGARRRGDG